MKEYHVTDEAYNLVRSKAIKPFESTGHQLPDGSWMVPLSDDVAEHVNKRALPGESFSDTIVRLISSRN